MISAQDQEGYLARHLRLRRLSIRWIGRKEPPRRTLEEAMNHRVMPGIRAGRKAGAALVALSLLVAACGGSPASPVAIAVPTDGSSTQPAGGSPSAGSPSAEPSAAAPSGNVRWMTWGDAAWYQDVADAFMKKYPAVKITLETTPYENYNEKVGAWNALGSGGPDVMNLEGGGAFQTYKNALKDITADVQDVWGGYTTKDFVCEDFDCSKSIRGLPYSLQGHPIFYNNNVLKAAGVDKVPTTWMELDAACQKVNASGKDCFAMGTKDGGAGLLWLPLVNYTATNAEINGVLTGKTNLEDPGIGSASVLLDWANKRGWFSKDQFDLNSYPDAADRFANGGAAFYPAIIGDDETLSYKRWDKVLGVGNWGVLRFPTLKPGDVPGVTPGPLAGQLDVSGATMMAIPTWSSNPTAALAFMKWVTGPEGSEIRLKSPITNFPVNKEYTAADIASPGFQDMRTYVLESTAPSIYWYLSLRAQGGVFGATSVMQPLLSGKITPAQANAELQQLNQNR